MRNAQARRSQWPVRLRRLPAGPPVGTRLMARRLSSGIDRSAPPLLTPRIVWSLLGETFFEWYEDRAQRLGAALAYYTVFALAPGLIVIIALAALLLGKEAACEFSSRVTLLLMASRTARGRRYCS
jgi:hypothetical protein